MARRNQQTDENMNENETVTNGTDTTATETTATETAGEAKATKSIINPKYKGKYKGASDFIGELIDSNCRSASEKGQGELNPSLVIQLGRKNNLDAKKLDNLEAQIGQKNAPGRIRMTVGNMLRAAAKRRHGLLDLHGNEVAAPEGFEVSDKTENLDGSRIAKAPEASEASAAEGAASE